MKGGAWGKKEVRSRVLNVDFGKKKKFKSKKKKRGGLQSQTLSGGRKKLRRQKLKGE